jgi:glyoxylase-like metal-dependent hydrolase (beta-lactamase superfamily II)
VVAHPDGELAAYLASLERIARLTGDGEVTAILPGHGPVVPDASAMVAFYRRHRAERLEQVRQALADGAQGVEDVVERVYAAVPREVWPAARLSVAAQLEYLEKVG